MQITMSRSPKQKQASLLFRPGGSVNAGTLTATTGDASVTAKKDVTIGTLDVKEHAELTSGGDMTLDNASADTLTAKAGTTLDATKIHTAGDAGLASGSDMILHAAEAGGKLTADAGGSISVKGTNSKISGSTIKMTAGEDIRHHGSFAGRQAGRCGYEHAGRVDHRQRRGRQSCHRRGEAA